MNCHVCGYKIYTDQFKNKNSEFGWKIFETEFDEIGVHYICHQTGSKKKMREIMEFKPFMKK